MIDFEIEDWDQRFLYLGRDAEIIADKIAAQMQEDVQARLNRHRAIVVDDRYDPAQFNE